MGLQSGTWLDDSEIRNSISRRTNGRRCCDREARRGNEVREIHQQRDALTRNPETPDPIPAERLGTAPASLTGISKTHRQQLIDRALEAQHGDKIAELRELERAIEAAESAVEAGRNEIRLEAGVFDPHKF